MLINNNGRVLIDLILPPNRRKLPLVYLPRPEVTGNGQQVRIVKKRLKVAPQTLIVAIMIPKLFRKLVFPV